jgi:Tn3 transposase DDE domain
MEINSGHERPFARLGQAELIFLARAVFHGKQGELRQRYREGQEDQLSSLQLEICLGRSKRVL